MWVASAAPAANWDTYLGDKAELASLLAGNGYEIAYYQPSRPPAPWRSKRARPVTGQYLAVRR